MTHTLKIMITHNGQLFGSTRKISSSVVQSAGQVVLLRELDNGIKFVRRSVESRINFFCTLERLGLV